MKRPERIGSLLCLENTRYDIPRRGELHPVRQLVCIQNNTCLDDASRWLDASIALDPNFGN
jgi:hypothetical protein